MSKKYDCEDDLKNCPFCGSSAYGKMSPNLHYGGHLSQHEWWIWCAVCGARGPVTNTAEDAKSKWNKILERP